MKKSNKTKTFYEEKIKVKKDKLNRVAILKWKNISKGQWIYD